MREIDMIGARTELTGIIAQRAYTLSEAQAGVSLLDLSVACSQIEAQGTSPGIQILARDVIGRSTDIPSWTYWETRGNNTLRDLKISSSDYQRIATAIALTTELSTTQLYMLGLSFPTKNMQRAAFALMEDSGLNLKPNRNQVDQVREIAQEIKPLTAELSARAKSMIEDDPRLEEVTKEEYNRLPQKEKERVLEDATLQKIRRMKNTVVFTKEENGIIKEFDEYTLMVQKCTKARVKDVVKDLLTQEDIVRLFREEVVKDLAEKIAQEAIRSAFMQTRPSLLPWFYKGGDLDIETVKELARAGLQEILDKELALKTKKKELSLLNLPNVSIENEQGDSAQILGMSQLACLTENNVMYLLEKMAQSPSVYGITIGEREEVKIYMVNKKTKEMLQKISGFLSDLSKIPDTVLLPETEDEMNCLLTMVAEAITTERPITLSTPFCPDWSRDREGKYDFKSLGGGESFIAAKFFANAPAILSAFQNNGIPFTGVLRFADWGLETEIDAKGTYGQKLSQEDVAMCFASTVSATDETLKALQNDPRLGNLFSSYRIVSMKEFLTSNIDIEEVKAKMRRFFTYDKKGRALLETLARQSFVINKKRLGLLSAANREFALNSLIEYATEGEAEDENTILIVCESRITSRCYNLPKDRDKKTPVLYVKGQIAVTEGVNIL